jgi:type II secretory pathway pseudopilin PulG
MVFLVTRRFKKVKGFTILEMMLATIILLVGVVAIAQLVPASILLNFRNRTDSSSLVFAQRELDQMLAQPLNLSSFLDAEGNTCQLGNSASPNVIQGSPVMASNNQTLIDFTAALQPGYNFTFQDPADPSRTTYDVRWAVIVTGNGTAVYAKRIILGIREQGGNGYFQPVTLDTMKAKDQ